MPDNLNNQNVEEKQNEIDALLNLDDIKMDGEDEEYDILKTTNFHINSIIFFNV